MTQLQRAKIAAATLIDAWANAADSVERERIAGVIASLSCPGETGSLVDRAFEAMRGGKE